MAQRAILCPRCRQLIGSDEKVCSWCGTSRSNPWWRVVAVTGAAQGDWVVKAIITANIFYYAVSLLVSVNNEGMRGLFSPGQNTLFTLGATGTLPLAYGRLWSLVSASYLHGGILHLLFNMMAVRQIAPWVAVEYGSSRMFVIYTFGGVIGYWVSYVAGIPFTIGASAAICAIIGSLLYYGKDRGGVHGNAVYREVSGWVISLFIFGLVFPGINNWAHGGGILGGIVLGMLLGYSEKRKENSFHHLLALLSVVTTVAVLGWAMLGLLR